MTSPVVAGDVGVVPVTNDKHQVVNADMLVAAEGVHRQLRPHLPEDYVARMEKIFANGAEMAVAVVAARVVGLTVFRVLEKTFSGRELYCDDLVADEDNRSAGIGRALMQYMEKIAHDRHCDTLALDSGTHREQAHKFYFREQLTVTAFHFSRKL